MATLLKRIPELTLLILLTVLAYTLMGLFSEIQGTPVLSPTAAGPSSSARSC